MLIELGARSSIDEVAHPSARLAGSSRSTFLLVVDVVAVRSHCIRSQCIRGLTSLQFPRPELETTVHEMVKDAPRLLQALVSCPHRCPCCHTFIITMYSLSLFTRRGGHVQIDYCLQRRWLQPILGSLELCQCIVQQLAPWDR